MLKYEGYCGEVRLALTHDNQVILTGRVIDIQDSITFQARSIESIEDEFRKAISDYLQLCKDCNQKPEQPVRQGTSYEVAYPLRVSPKMRQLIQKAATRNRTTVNCWLEKSLPTSSPSVQHFLDNPEALESLTEALYPHLEIDSIPEFHYALEKLLVGLDEIRRFIDLSDREALTKVLLKVEAALEDTPVAHQQTAHASRHAGTLTVGEQMR